MSQDPSELPTVSEEELVSIVGEGADGKELLGELLTLFTDDAPKRLAAAKEAATREDVKAMEHEIHTLKGSSGNLGALKLAALCGNFTAKLRGGNLEGIEADLVAIEQEYGQVAQPLKARLD